jgi:hypothetical protein
VLGGEGGKKQNAGSDGKIYSKSKCRSFGTREERRDDTSSVLSFSICQVGRMQQSWKQQRELYQIPPIIP